MLLLCLMGASVHTSHAADILDGIIKKCGPDTKISLGSYVDLEAPHIRTVLGLKPETLGDLKIVIEYIYKQITHLLDSTTMGQEGDPLDFESKALHAGMLDHVAYHPYTDLLHF